MLTAGDYHRLLRNDLSVFIERSFRELHPSTPFLHAPFIDVLASKLEACRRGEILRLAICVPPRSLKSLAASIALPAYWLGHDPSARIICASYGQDLASKFARDTRQIMTRAWYQAAFPRTRIAPDRKATDDFATTAQGGRMATSKGGVLTGRGADLIILDDPLKPEEALSDVARKGLNDWYDNTLSSRLNDKRTGVIIVVMQRLHQDDLVGHVLEQGGWDVLSLPAIAIEHEHMLIESPLGRYSFVRGPGDLLHPQRDTLAYLEDTRRRIGDYTFLAQYQQTPVPQGGAIVKEEWLSYYEPAQRPESFQLVVQSWDTANKAAETNDYSVCTTWGILRDRYYLLDVFRDRLIYPHLKRKVRELAEKFGANAIVIEDKASGTQLLQDLQADGVPGLRPYQPPAGMDKIMRLHAQTIAFEAGKVFLPDGAPFIRAYVDELLGFPGSKYYDQVDSTTQALDFMRSKYNGEQWIKLAGG